MFKRFVENKIYEHVHTVKVDDKYHIENYVDRTSDDFVVMRKHKQGFLLRILFFKKVVWLTSKIEVMAMPERVIQELIHFDTRNFKYTEKLRDELPLYSWLKDGLFEPLAKDTRFTAAEVFYAKEFEDGAFKVLSTSYYKVDKEVYVLDVGSMTVTPEVLDRFKTMLTNAEYIDKLKEEENE